MNTAEYELIDNRENKRYAINIGSDVAFIEYVLSTAGEIFLTHTEVPKIMEGKGVGSALVLKVLKDIEERNLRLIPLCPFVATYIKRHPEWRRLIMK